MSERPVVKAVFFDDGRGYLISEEQYAEVVKSTVEMMQRPDFRDNTEAYLTRRKMFVKIARHPNNSVKMRTDASMMQRTLSIAFNARYGKCSEASPSHSQVMYGVKVRKTAEEFEFKPQPLALGVKHYIPGSGIVK